MDKYFAFAENPDLLFCFHAYSAGADIFYPSFAEAHDLRPPSVISQRTVKQTLYEPFI